MSFLPYNQQVSHLPMVSQRRVTLTVKQGVQHPLSSQLCFPLAFGYRLLPARLESVPLAGPGRLAPLVVSYGLLQVILEFLSRRVLSYTSLSCKYPGGKSEGKRSPRSYERSSKINIMVRELHRMLKSYTREAGEEQTTSKQEATNKEEVQDNNKELLSPHG